MSNKRSNIDFSDISKFSKRIQQAADGDFKKQLPFFLEGLGFDLLRIVQDEIIRRKVIDTRLLLASFTKGNGSNVWKLNVGGLSLEIGTNVKYAAWVNDGHSTTPKGIAQRFVPGRWEGDRFVYESGAKTGMLLKQKWVEGKHYWESAIRIMEKILPNILDAMVQKWFDEYFSEFK